MSTRYLSVAQVLTIHQQLMLDYGQDAQLVFLGEAGERRCLAGYRVIWARVLPSLAEKPPHRLQAIVIAHPFMDGNKRAGLGAMLAFLRLNNVRDRPDPGELYDFVIAVTTGELREVGDIAARLRLLFPSAG
ncbi:MAG: hypothetical protein U5Q44_11660 [Dehalococcoidia bacterium]|nr:hypothetical protein [Dehalococcoidia bacterium]